MSGRAVGRWGRSCGPAEQPRLRAAASGGHRRACDVESVPGSRPNRCHDRAAPRRPWFARCWLPTRAVACAFRSGIAKAPAIPIRTCHRLRAASSPNGQEAQGAGGPACRGGSSLHGFRWRVPWGDRTHAQAGGLGSPSKSGPAPCRWRRHRRSHRALASCLSCSAMKPLAGAARGSPDDAASHLDFAGWSH